MGELGDGGSFGYVGWKIEEGVAVVVLGDLDEVLRACVREEIDPFLWIEGGGGEVLDERVVGMVGTVRSKIVLVGLVTRSGSLALIPPIPLCVTFIVARITPARYGVDAPVDEDAKFGVIIPKDVSILDSNGYTLVY